MDEVPVEIKIECPNPGGPWPQSLEWGGPLMGSPTPASSKTDSQSGSSQVTENALPIRGTEGDNSDYDEVCPQPVFVAVKEEPVEEMVDESREIDIYHSSYPQGSINRFSGHPHMEYNFEIASLGETVGMSAQEHSSKRAFTSEHGTLFLQNLQHPMSFAVASCCTAVRQEEEQVAGEKQAERGEREMQKTASLKSSSEESGSGCSGETYECFTCKKQFPCKSELDRHIQVHAAERRYKCNECEESFLKSEHLSVHMLIHERPFKCSQCEKTFHIKSQLTVHMRYHTGERPYKCTQCEKAFRRSSDRTGHMRIHRERPYKCSQCEKSYNRRDYLTMHMFSHMPFKCSQCEKSFQESGQLAEHMHIHTPKKL